jgi:hypothetical protein
MDRGVRAAYRGKTHVGPDLVVTASAVASSYLAGLQMWVGGAGRRQAAATREGRRPLAPPAGTWKHHRVGRRTLAAVVWLLQPLLAVPDGAVARHSPPIEWRMAAWAGGQIRSIDLVNTDDKEAREVRNAAVHTCVGADLFPAAGYRSGTTSAAAPILRTSCRQRSPPRSCAAPALALPPSPRPSRSSVLSPHVAWSALCLQLCACICSRVPRTCSCFPQAASASPWLRPGPPPSLPPRPRHGLLPPLPPPPRRTCPVRSALLPTPPSRSSASPTALLPLPPSFPRAMEKWAAHLRSSEPWRTRRRRGPARWRRRSPHGGWAEGQGGSDPDGAPTAAARAPWPGWRLPRVGSLRAARLCCVGTSQGFELGVRRALINLVGDGPRRTGRGRVRQAC